VPFIPDPVAAISALQRFSAVISEWDSGGLSAPETPAITADRKFFVKISELDENLRLIFPDPEVSLKLSYHFKLNKSGGRGSCIRS